nr:MAG TPA: YqbN [Caudoviricetes sp.]
MAKKAELKKLTLSDLIARKEQREAGRIDYRDVKVEALDGALTLKKLPLSQVLTMLDDQNENASMKENLDFEVELIYKSCPMLQNKELQEAYGCQEPYDIVLRVLDDNVGALAELASAVLDFYGMGDSIRDQLKN